MDTFVSHVFRIHSAEYTKECFMTFPSRYIFREISSISELFSNLNQLIEWEIKRTGKSHFPTASTRDP